MIDGAQFKEMQSSVLSTMFHDFTLYEWFQTPFGQHILQREFEVLEKIIQPIYAFYGLQCGLHYFDFLKQSLIQHRGYIQTAKQYNQNFQSNQRDSLILCENYYQLPFESHSIDLIVMPHVLEFRKNPTAVLHEINRVLALDGKLIITGFNPISLLGLSYRFKTLLNKNQKQHQFIRLDILKRWLRELGFEIQQGQFKSYVPPIQSNQWISRLKFLDKAGDRWWAIAGSVYFIQAIKRTIPLIPIQFKDKRFKINIANPALCLKDQNDFNCNL